MIPFFRPPIDSIDFFANTLNIRKNAIEPYENYNPYEEEDEISINLGENNNEVVEVISAMINKILSHIFLKDKNFYNKFLNEECPPPYKSSLSSEDNLKPVTLAEILDTEEHEDTQTSWREHFEMNKKEIDFNENTLDIRKNAIETYIDYKMESFQTDADVEEEASSSDTVTNNSDSDEDEETIELVSVCPKCGNSKLTRNLKIERIIKLYDQMMHYRNLVES